MCNCRKTPQPPVTSAQTASVSQPVPVVETVRDAQSAANAIGNASS